MFSKIYGTYKAQREQRRAEERIEREEQMHDMFNEMAFMELDGIMDRLMDLCERYVKSQERIATALERMSCDGKSPYTGKHLYGDGSIR